MKKRDSKSGEAMAVKKGGEDKIGLISMMNFERGFGFITVPEEGENGNEYFFHVSDVREDAGDLDSNTDKFETLNTGDRVKFVSLFNLKLKKYKALGVSKVEKEKEKEGEKK